MNIIVIVQCFISPPRFPFAQLVNIIVIMQCFIFPPRFSFAQLVNIIVIVQCFLFPPRFPFAQLVNIIVIVQCFIFLPLYIAMFVEGPPGQTWLSPCVFVFIVVNCLFGLHEIGVELQMP